jgi:hypothetical protein
MNRRYESHTTWTRADEREKDAARSADRPRGQKTQNEKTKEDKSNIVKDNKESTEQKRTN